MPVLETPNMMRGNFYSTHLTRRCPSFRKCPLCSRCRNYCRYFVQCEVCESRKTNIDQRLCNCTDENIRNFMIIQERKKAPLFDSGGKDEGVVQVVDGSEMEDWDNLIAGLNFRPTED